MILDELAVAGERHGIAAGLLIAADRTVDPRMALAQARIAVRYADDGVVAFGLHNDEVGFPPEPFADAFALAREGRSAERAPRRRARRARVASPGRSTPSGPTASSTASGRSRTPSCWRAWRRRTCASTSARRAT